MKTMTKMKNFLSSTLLLLALLIPTTAAAYDFEVDGIYYGIKDNEAVVTFKEIFFDHGAVPHHYSDYSGNVVIPSSVTHDGKTYPVTAIGSSAFNNSIMKKCQSRHIPRLFIFREYSVFYVAFRLEIISVCEDFLLQEKNCQREMQKSLI